MLGPDRVIVAPVEVKLQYLILSLERSSTQHTHIVRESPHHVQLLARKDIVLLLISQSLLTAVCPLFLKVPLERRESFSTSLVSSLLASIAILTYHQVREKEGLEQSTDLVVVGHDERRDLCCRRGRRWRDVYRRLGLSSALLIMQVLGRRRHV